MATLTVGGGGREPKTYELKSASCTVGREASCDIHIDNVAVSKKHCEIVNREGKFFVKDLGSSNGTYVGTEKVTEKQLKDGDEIILGSYSLKYENKAEREATPDVPVPTDGGDMMTLQLSPEMMRKKLEELKQEKEKAASDKVMTAKEYGAQFSPPSGQSSEPTPANTKTGVIILVVAMIVVWGIALAIFMGRGK